MCGVQIHKYTKREEGDKSYKSYMGRILREGEWTRLSGWVNKGGASVKERTESESVIGRMAGIVKICRGGAKEGKQTTVVCLNLERRL